ncbi:MAG: class I SAM-dependent methyltransferase [Synergistaceae bacterium]|nr:class I SAM-dependent methyltransferase [Synergistaceae bacterium]
MAFKPIKKFLQYHFNAHNENSMAHKFRMKRMIFFERCFINAFNEKITKHVPVTVLDVGGTWNFWEAMHFNALNLCDITLLNLNEIKIPERFTNIKSVVGDATDLSQYADNAFDLVFSNSVIEHVGKEPAQKKMADEVLRVGKHLYLQTPNKNFPIEPHFIFPLFQFLPLRVRAFLVSHFAIGWYKKAVSREEALRVADSVDLLTKRRLQKFFPSAKIQKEKFLGLTKSFYFFT